MFWQKANVTLQKSDPFMFCFEVDFSELSNCEQRHQPVTMVLLNRFMSVSSNNINNGWISKSQHRITTSCDYLTACGKIASTCVSIPMLRAAPAGGQRLSSPVRGRKHRWSEVSCQYCKFIFLCFCRKFMSLPEWIVSIQSICILVLFIHRASGVYRHWNPD